jgi:hypothetical protein
VMVRESPLTQVWGTVIVQGPVPLNVGVPGAHDVPVPLATATLRAVGAVQPAGTTTVAYEPAENWVRAGEV